MKWSVILSSIASIGLLAGCGGGAERPGPIKLGGTDSAEVKNAEQAMKNQPVDDSPVPPADATWTIICATFKGSGHVEQAKVFKQMIVAKTGWKAFYLVHSDDVSTLYYGYYSHIDPHGADANGDDVDKAAKEGQRAQDDLARVRSLENSLSDRLFAHAGIQPLEPADPAAPPEWDLKNMDRYKPPTDPTRAYYTLEIAIYKDSPLRKQAAVDSVKALRDKGVKNAYFFHGPTVSSVCIGVWPESAVSVQLPDRGDPNDRLLVVPPGVPDAMVANLHDETGHSIRPVQVKAVPVDPTLIDTMTKYDRLSVNGYDIQHTYKGKDGGDVVQYEPSMVMFIPRQEESSSLDQNQSNGTDDPGSMQMPNQPNNGGGRLRSLGGSGGAQ